MVDSKARVDDGPVKLKKWPWDSEGDIDLLGGTFLQGLRSSQLDKTSAAKIYMPQAFIMQQLSLASYL